MSMSLLLVSLLLDNDNCTGELMDFLIRYTHFCKVTTWVMYYDEHNPPHFHAIYSEDEGQIGIAPLALLRGQLSSRALALAIEWAALHQRELLENWELMRQDQPPRKIEPLK
jgi:hypothetical protein